MSSRFLPDVPPEPKSPQQPKDVVRDGDSETQLLPPAGTAALEREVLSSDGQSAVVPPVGATQTPAPGSQPAPTAPRKSSSGLFVSGSRGGDSIWMRFFTLAAVLLIVASASLLVAGTWFVGRWVVDGVSSWFEGPDGIVCELPSAPRPGTIDAALFSVPPLVRDGIMTAELHQLLRAGSTVSLDGSVARQSRFRSGSLRVTRMNGRPAEVGRVVVTFDPAVPVCFGLAKLGLIASDGDFMVNAQGVVEGPLVSGIRVKTRMVDGQIHEVGIELDVD